MDEFSIMLIEYDKKTGEATGREWLLPEEFIILFKEEVHCIDYPIEHDRLRYSIERFQQLTIEEAKQLIETNSKEFWKKAYSKYLPSKKLHQVLDEVKDNEEISVDV